MTTARRISFLFAFLIIPVSPAGALKLASPASAAANQQQSVVIRLRLSTDMGENGESFALYDIEDAVTSAVSTIGDVDGHEIGGGYFTIFIYGSDARKIFEAARPALSGPLVKRGSYAILQGSAGGKLIARIDLPASSTADQKH